MTSSSVERVSSTPYRASFDEKKDHGEATVVLVEDGVHGEVALERNFTFLATLGLAFSLLNSWTAMAASLQIVLTSGGSVAMVWGLLVSAFGTLAMGVSLAEICHVFPLSGGQYDFSYCLATPKYKRGIAFFVGWMACAGWTTLLGAAASLACSYMLGIITFWHPDFEIANWLVFVIYAAFLVVVFLVNVFGVRILPAIDRANGMFSIVGIVVVCITLLACSSGKYQPAKSVFGTLTNETGWPDGMAFVLGLLQSTLGLTAFDSASHLIEEMPKPSINAPRVMVLAIVMGTVTAWIFMVVLLFCLRDWDGVINASSGALLEIYYQATESRAGAMCLLMFNLVAMTVCLQCVNTISSRMFLSFARDRGLGAISRYFVDVHPSLKSPIWSIVFVTVWAIIFGLINLGSSVALNAILSGAILFLQISYVTPIIIIFIRGEEAYAGHSRIWSLGKWRRYVNAVAILFAVCTSVIFVFPPAIPVPTGSSMNYAIVVFFIVLIMCAATWLIDGRKNFQGPNQLEQRLAIGKNA